MQAKIIRPSERSQYSAPLLEMHHHRKQVFIDRLGWKLAAPGSWLEVDQFDNDEAVYVMIIGPDDRHVGSVRLLPTTGPHMLGTMFNGILPGPAPVGPRIWEVSRLVAAPEGASGKAILRIHRILATALVEFAVANNIDRYVLVAESRRVPALLSAGWKVLPLSLPTRFEGELVEAMMIVLDEASCAEVRRRSGCASAIFTPVPLRSAA